MVPTRAQVHILCVNFRRRKAIKRKRANGEFAVRRGEASAEQRWQERANKSHKHGRGSAGQLMRTHAACTQEWWRAGMLQMSRVLSSVVCGPRVLARSTSMAGGAYVQRPELRMSTIEPTLATTRQPTRCLHVFSRTPVARLPHTDFACAWLHEACVPTCRTSATVLRQPLV